MAFKPNYYQERASRERIKSSRKEEKLRQREEASTQRRVARENATDETSREDCETGSAQIASLQRGKA